MFDTGKMWTNLNLRVFEKTSNSGVDRPFHYMMREERRNRQIWRLF